MPIYQYECPKGHEFELISHHGEQIEAFRQCEECAKKNEFGTAKKIPTVWGNYKIKGNNSASNTPKRWKGF